MRALALRCQLAPDRGTYTVLIPLEKSEGKNELVGQNEMNQRREHVVKVSKVPKMISCGSPCLRCGGGGVEVSCFWITVDGLTAERVVVKPVV